MESSQQQQQQQHQTGTGVSHPFQPLPNPSQGSQWGGELQQMSPFHHQTQQPPPQQQGAFQLPHQQAASGAQVQQPPQQNPGFQTQQAPNQQSFGFQQGAVPMQPYHQQAPPALQTQMQQFQPQGMGMPFGQPYPPFFQQPVMGGYPMSQLQPNMMGGMFTAPPQMWMQPSAVPQQPITMDIDEDAARFKEIKSSSSSKRKEKGKAKASETFTRQQRVEETEENLDQLLRRIESAGIDIEVARLAEYDEAMVTVVEGLLARIDMLRSEKRETERALLKEENEKIRLQDEVLRLKDRRREDSSRQEDEERYGKKRKGREYERPSYDYHDERELRNYPSRASDSAREYQDRSVRPLPSSSSSRQSSHYAPPPIASASRGRDVSPPRRDRDKSPPQAYGQSSAADFRPRDRQQQAKPPVASSSRLEDVPPERDQRNKDMDPLQSILTMPDSYPPPPTLTVAPPIVPRRLPSPPTDFEDDSDDALPREKGKKGGPSVPGHVQDANRLANTSVGAIPALLGACLIEGEWERDNSFRGMLSRNYLYVASENTVYPGAAAYEYYLWNRDGRSGPNPASSREWLSASPRGMPRTVNECKNLRKVLTNTKAKKEDRFEAWLLLTEFHYVSNCFSPLQRDHVMQWAVQHMGKVHRPGLWQNFQLVPLDPAAFNPPGSDNANIRNPDADLALVIDPWAQVILHHGRPGMRNAYYGIIMDRAFRVSRRSVWGYLLGRAISPTSSRGGARTIVARQFAYLAAVPTAYIEAVEEHERLNGPGYLLSPATRTVTITRISVDEALAPNFGRHDLVMNLLHNRIPVEWLTNAYPHGVQYVRQHLAANDKFHNEYLAVEHERSVRLLREPQAYPPFSGWYHPSPTDITRLRYLMYREEQRKEFSRASLWWVNVGDCVFPPLPTSGGSSTSQLPGSSSSSSHDVEMRESSTMAVGEQSEDLGVAISMVTLGVEGEPSTMPLSGEGLTIPAQDVVMHGAAPGVEEESSALSGSSGAPAMSSK